MDQGPRHRAGNPAGGQVWHKTETSIDVTGYNHNVIGGYGAPQITLGAAGTGNATFRQFRYREA